MYPDVIIYSDEIISKYSSIIDCNSEETISNDVDIRSVVNGCTSPPLPNLKLSTSVEQLF